MLFLPQKYLIPFFLFIISSQLLCAQSVDEDRVKLDKYVVNRNSVELGIELLETYHYDAFIFEKMGIPIKLPLLKECTDTAFALLYFKETDEQYSIKNYRLVVIANYKTDTPLIYFNHEGSYDFSHISPIAFKRDAMSVRFFKQGGAAITYQLQKPDKRIDPDNFMMEKKPFSFRQIERKHCFVYRVNNLLAGDFNKKDDLFRIGLMDADLNGLYNNTGTDFIFIGKAGQDTFYTQQGISCKIIDSENYLESSGRNKYMISEIDPSGMFIKIQHSDETDKEFLKPFDHIPEGEFKLISGKSISFNSYLHQNKLIYIDIWGIWCPPCVASIPALKQLKEKFDNQLIIISLNDRDSKEKLDTFITTKQMTWAQGINSESISKNLMQDGYPWGVLFNERGELIKVNMKAEELLKYMEAKY